MFLSHLFNSAKLKYIQLEQAVLFKNVSFTQTFVCSFSVSFVCERHLGLLLELELGCSFSQ